MGLRKLALLAASLCLCIVSSSALAPPTPTPLAPRSPEPVHTRVPIVINEDEAPDWTPHKYRENMPQFSAGLASPQYTTDNPPPLSRLPADMTLGPMSRTAVDQADLRQDWNILRGLCFSQTSGDFAYTLCPFGNFTQRNTVSGAVAVIGLYEDWIVTEEGHLAQRYTDGCICPEADSPRKAVVTVSCSEDDGDLGALPLGEHLRAHSSLLSVAEDAPCHYSAMLVLPPVAMVCNHDGERRKQFKLARAERIVAEDERRRAAGPAPDGGAGTGAWEKSPASLRQCQAQQQFLVTEMHAVHLCFSRAAALLALPGPHRVPDGCEQYVLSRLPPEKTAPAAPTESVEDDEDTEVSGAADEVAERAPEIAPEPGSAAAPPEDAPEEPLIAEVSALGDAALVVDG